MWLWLLGESWGKWCSMSVLERHGFDSSKKRKKGKERNHKFSPSRGEGSPYLGLIQQV